MKNLVEVDNFGGNEADKDALLDECFEDHEAYVAAKNHERFLIIGRKGSGKTAIFRKFVNTHQHDVFTFGHTFSDYPWQHHDLQEKTGVPAEERFLHSWKYLIYLTLSKILLNQDQTQPWDASVVEDLASIEKFVIDSYGTRNPEVTQIFSPGKRLKLQPSLKIDLTLFKAELKLDNLPIAELPTVVQEVNQNLGKSLINSLNPSFDYFISFDQLDLGLSLTDPVYEGRLIGLILAARDINFLAQSFKKKFSVIIFLRDDIYQRLHFEDKNKLTVNSCSRIEWDTLRTKRTLKQLMEKRFAKVLEIEEANAWQNVFDEGQEMTGHQTKYQHIIDRTFLRPRDMIQFCNEVLRTFKASGRQGTTFENSDVIGARSEYSQYLIGELDDEVHKHVPEYEAYIEILKTLDSLQFSLDDFHRSFEDRRKLLPPEIEPSTILKTLFDFSLVGYYSAGGDGLGGSEYIWKYKDPRAQFNETAKAFRIHPGFKEVLGLKKFTRSDNH